MDWMRTCKAIVERHGARNVRLLSAVVAGEATGTMAFVIEADDFAHIGAITDKFMADPASVAPCPAPAGERRRGGLALWHLLQRPAVAVGVAEGHKRAPRLNIDLAGGDTKFPVHA
jgi:hypothetical protein